MLILFTVVLLGALARKLHLMNDAFDALLSKHDGGASRYDPKFGVGQHEFARFQHHPDVAGVFDRALLFHLFVCVGFRACGVSGRAEAGAGCACLSHIVRKYGLYRLCGVGRHHGE